MVDENSNCEASGSSSTSNMNASTAANVDKVSFLRLKTQSIFNRLEHVCQDIDDNKLAALDEYALNALLDLLSKLETNFDAAHSSLEEIYFDAMSSELPAQFCSALMQLRTTLQRALSKLSSMPLSSTLKPNPTDTQSVIVIPSRSRLPHLTLPSFDGSYADWTNFYSLFTSIIDKETKLSSIEKLQHLRSCLTGTALNAIQSLEINEGNYTIAWEVLKNRFYNKHIILQAHIREILGLEKVDASAGKLREFTDKVTSHLCASESFASKEEIADCIIVQSLTHMLDKASQAKWKEASSSSELPSWNKLKIFLKKRCRTLENMDFALQKDHTGKSGKTVSTTQRKSFIASNEPIRCSFCESTSHQIYQCPRFGNLSPNLRQKEAKRLSLCLNCLKAGHQVRDCKSGCCRTCRAKHHSLLHFTQTSPIGTHNTTHELAVGSFPAVSTTPASPTSHQALVSHSTSDAVLLATAVVLIKNNSGSFVPCRALLDSGSQLHFVTTRFANQLQLRKIKTQAAVSGIGDANFKTEGHSVDLVLKSRTSDFVASLTAVIAQTITENQPGVSVSTFSFNVPSNIKLADPSFNIPQRIDLLIGAGLFFELLCIGQIQLAPGLPLLQKTQLGWILSGGGHRTPKLSSFVVNQRSSNASTHSTRLDGLVRRFWEIDFQVEPISKATKEELACEAHFQQNFVRLPSGEYSVRLPFTHGPESLGESYMQARRRLENLERKLVRAPHLKTQYSAFMKEYVDLNHMSLVPSADMHRCQYFLPHHCVLKEDSTTTKLRVVFDGSAPTTSGLSLNHILMAGPTIQERLFNILIRFRTFPIALTADICKMYRCVRLAAPDDWFQCILWRDSPEEDIKCYKLNTVTYGTKPAAFLAIRAMHQLAKDQSLDYPLGSRIVLQHFYVDDMISGGSSLEEVRSIMDQSTKLLSKGNFRLRKWCSNRPDVINDIPNSERESLLKFDDNVDVTKALGLVWEPREDAFLFTFTLHDDCKSRTKRSILATIARCYDPLGLIGPTMTRAKIILQRMWREKLAWDESLPQLLATAWKKFCDDFIEMHHAKFPRYVLLPSAVLELHAFCDASLEAYGACIYTVSRTRSQVQSHLLCSKARIAPLKTITIPKLELCAAHLLAQLVSEIVKMKIFNCKVYCWSDSSVVLSWLLEESSKFNVFVANRICAIQELTSDMEWRYVPTSMYPADILSKGASPKGLLHSALWLRGPPFLQENLDQWPAHCLPQLQLPDIRKKILLVTSDYGDMSLSLKYINSFGITQRIFGYVHKFINLRTSSKSVQLSAENIRLGTYILIRVVQRAHLHEEYIKLQKKKIVSSSSIISSLCPFLDDFGLMRVGGRLTNSTLGFDARHPILLPKNHPLTLSIVTYFHRKYHHAGPQALLAAI